MDCETCNDGLLDLLDGALDPARDAALRAALDRCPACRAEWEAMQATLEAYGHLQDPEVPEHLTRGILAALDAHAPARPPVRRAWASWTSPTRWIALAATCGVLAVSVNLARRIPRPPDDVPMEAAAVQPGLPAPVLSGAAEAATGASATRPGIQEPAAEETDMEVSAGLAPEPPPLPASEAAAAPVAAALPRQASEPAPAPPVRTGQSADVPAGRPPPRERRDLEGLAENRAAPDARPTPRSSSVSGIGAASGAGTPEGYGRGSAGLTPPAARAPAAPAGPVQGGSSASAEGAAPSPTRQAAAADESIASLSRREARRQEAETRARQARSADSMAVPGGTQPLSDAVPAEEEVTDRDDAPGAARAPAPVHAARADAWLRSPTTLADGEAITRACLDAGDEPRARQVVARMEAIDADAPETRRARALLPR